MSPPLYGGRTPQTQTEHTGGVGEYAYVIVALLGVLVGFCIMALLRGCV
jgi:hypothetical protein